MFKAKILLITLFIPLLLITAVSAIRFFSLSKYDEKIIFESNQLINNGVADSDFYDEKSKCFNILILGGDFVYNNTDTIIVVNYNPVNNRIVFLSVPRDTKVKIDGHNHKINFAYPQGGVKLSQEIISNLLKIDLKYYVFINTSVFREIVDMLGGVDYNVPVNMYYEDPTQGLYINLKKGFQHLDGNNSEQLVRYRKNYDDGDLKRIEVQQDFLRQFLNQKLKVKYLPELKNITVSLCKNIETNISAIEALNLLRSYMQKKNGNNIFLTLPGRVIEGNAWYFIHDEEKTDEIINKYFKL